MDNRTFLYLRVSSKDQNLDRQYLSLMNYCKMNGIKVDETRDVFTDKESGKDFNREGYQTLKKVLRAGDTLIIKELDRLGRNKEEVKRELNYFKTNNIRVKILNIPTTLMDLPEGNEWVMDMVNNILIEVLGAIAQEERVKIRQRQAEGIAAAKAKGKHLGRPKVEYPKNWSNVYTSWKDEKITAKVAMELTGLKRTTFYALVKKYEEMVK
ncbi:MAG: recombinase family protein [Clostridium celatum]|nr:recombinase family protein [Clostridium celatum]